MSKSAKVKGAVRSSQLVTTYGVGSMVAVEGGESFIIADIDRWPEHDETIIHEPRLQERLRVFEFRSPPARGEDAWDIPVRRFPMMHSCSTCHRIEEFWRFTGPYGKAECSFCEEQPALVPSRFVMACVDGHLDEFPYFHWAHRDQPHPTGQKAKLRLRSRGESSGLGDIVVSCSCGASRSMAGVFRKAALRGVRRCQGGRPWQNQLTTAEPCDRRPMVLQRGATNVWFPNTVSAISIPPWSEGAFRILDRWWKVLAAVPPQSLAATIEGLNMADDRHSLEDLIGAAEYRRRQEMGDDGDTAESDDVRYAEYEALVRGAPERDRHDEFVCLDADDPGDVARDYFPLIHKVTRLREIRVLRGFSRISPAASTEEPPHGEEEDRPGRPVELQADKAGWLPAIEVSGEGVFLELAGPSEAGQRLYGWEKRPDVVERVGRLVANAENAYFDVVASPRIVMIHTLAHALIDQWALECGYPAAALRERLYVNESQAGLLIYTASTDSAGSLGGVVAMTDGGRLSISLLEALRRSSWCSGDPLCIETATQGPDSLNLAACHACALLPESSCEQRNLLLDRALLIGTPANPDLGYFSELLD